MLAIDLNSVKYCVETEYIKLMRNVNKGFTLIELMIAVAIIAVLVAVGVPQYQNYVARSQAIEGVNLAGGIKTALAEYYNTNGAFPAGTGDANAQLGIEAATAVIGKYVVGVAVSDDGLGMITASFGSGNHAGKYIRLKAVATDGSVSFECDSDIDESFRPSECAAPIEASALLDNFIAVHYSFNKSSAGYPEMPENPKPGSARCDLNLAKGLKCKYRWESHLQRALYFDEVVKWQTLNSKPANKIAASETKRDNSLGDAADPSDKLYTPLYEIYKELSDTI